MSAFLSTFWQVITLSNEPMDKLRENPASFWFAVRFFVLITLFAGLGSLIGIVDAFQPTFTERTNTAVAEFTERIESLPRIFSAPFGGLLDTLNKLDQSIQELQPPVGPTTSQVLRILGAWFSAPLVQLGNWLMAILTVWLVAVFLGYQGSFRKHISLMLLACAPMILTLPAGIPTWVWDSWGIGSAAGWLIRLLGLVVLIWVIVIATRALASAHQISYGQSFVALLLAFLFVVIVIPIVLGLPVALLMVLI